MAGPALTIAGPYAKRIAWGPIWVGMRIITINVGPLEVLGPLQSAPTYVECTLYGEERSLD